MLQFTALNRLLSKLAHVRQMQGAYGAQKRSVLSVHEHSSTGATLQLTTGVEFQKKSSVHGHSSTRATLPLTTGVEFRKKSNKPSVIKPSVIITHTARFMLPFIIAFGIYIQLNSHDSPGGGFQAGAIMASVFILYALVFGINSALQKIPFPWLLNLASIGIGIYLLTGLCAVLRRKTFLDYNVFDNPFVNGHKLGIFLVELGVGFTVFSIMCLLYSIFVKGR